jgi:hypothetical protein
MSQIRFEEDELTLVGAFAAKTRQETIDALRGALDVIEETKEDLSDEEMILLLSSTIEKLQHTEDELFYSLSLQEYLNNIEEVDDEN